MHQWALLLLLAALGLGSCSGVEQDVFDFGGSEEAPISSPEDQPEDRPEDFPEDPPAEDPVVVENTPAPARSMQDDFHYADLNFDAVSIHVGPDDSQTLFDRKNFRHWDRTRYQARSWLGLIPPELAVRQSLRTLVKAGFLPKYDYAQPLSDRVARQQALSMISRSKASRRSIASECSRRRIWPRAWRRSPSSTGSASSWPPVSRSARRRPGLLKKGRHGSRIDPLAINSCTRIPLPTRTPPLSTPRRPIDKVFWTAYPSQSISNLQ